MNTVCSVHNWVSRMTVLLNTLNLFVQQLWVEKNVNSVAVVRNFTHIFTNMTIMMTRTVCVPMLQWWHYCKAPLISHAMLVNVILHSNHFTATIYRSTCVSWYPTEGFCRNKILRVQMPLLRASTALTEDAKVLNKLTYTGSILQT